MIDRRDALHLNTLQLCSICIALDVCDYTLQMDTFQLLHSTSKPPCHKMPCSGYSLFDCPASLSWFMFFIWKRFLVVQAVTYYNSSIIPPLAHCTTIDAAFEQVNPFLQRDYCCVICQESWLQYLLFKHWQNIVLFILIWHIEAFLWQTCLSLLLFLMFAFFLSLSICLSCSLALSLSHFMATNY